MFKSIRIGSKITGLVFVVALISVLTVSFITFNLSRQALEEKHLENLNVIASLKAERIESFFKQTRVNALLIQDSELIRAGLDVASEIDEFNLEEKLVEIDYTVGRYLQSSTSTFAYSGVYIVNHEGLVLYSTSRDYQTPGQLFNDPDGNTLNKSKVGLHFSNVFFSNNLPNILVGAPLIDSYNTPSGMLLIQISIQPIYEMLQDTTGLGNTGETYIGKLLNNKAIFLNPLRHDAEAALQKGVYQNEKKEAALQFAVKGKQGSGKDIDYRGKEVISSWQYIPTADWGFVAKIDLDEVHEGANRLLNTFLIASAIILILSSLIAITFSRMLINPLLSLKGTLQMIGKGILPDQVEIKSNDEIGQMAATTDNLVKALKRTANFAHKIGEGDFDADFKPLGENDTLGNALITMRDSIQNAEKQDKERNWIVTGVAEIGEILRRNDHLDELGDQILAYVTQKIHAIQGAFYVVNDDNPKSEYIEMTASYAYNKKKYLKASFKFAEGLIGQAAIEQDTIIRTEIPDDYVTITSGLLGDKRPKCILIVPLITDEKVFGVLEFAGFEKFNGTEVKFVQEISIILARTIFNIKVNERTRRLLDESQKMSHELQEQQEILRQNAEEMEATQEELRRTNQRLEDQIEEVNRTQKRMQLLLENASEVITIYEEDLSVRYISPSVDRILGWSQNDLIGKKDTDKVHEEWREAVANMFKQLLENPKEQVTIQYIYTRKDGGSIWLEATGTNLLSDKAIQGIIINSRDITERRRAEQEERMRSKMQALSENSPDLITRFDQHGNVFYINPMIETYTGKSPSHFLQKHIGEAEIHTSIVDEWMQILKEVHEKGEKVSHEIDFPSEIGDRIMQVNAIPEFDEEQKLESVLVVSHDITKRKLIELEIQTKNKKITESINYSRRIQGAILPDTVIVNKVLPESFILYKPRDVVSGDFPWFIQMGDDIYIAAVDCTGHGVPGALISLIGYFLLNDIVRSRKISDPGQILDLLDEGVTQTLRQDQDDSKTKDGMDIAFCKINLKKGEVEYAGAHRPLYWLKGAELEEIKGNKFPIGGGIYKNQTNFTNTKFKVSKGDSIYFCSDGFPDQFGGENNMKFGPKRLRTILLENHDQSMEKIHEALDTQWEAWKGDYKQTDDVLLIGIRF
ncbi:PAS domain S-box protein [Cytophagales bacterium LB-30]|uniref:PAS domain S-box protein n=1 Tax=Shiella aurantiaca TaxID=3058365 RepID=A0ABT8F9S1_9BACT|nr:PAS domain S-box protein [Shiella aurantiaca]MDN4166946.1 PAS domain S-box protein [Shiella aurantiaca]